MAFWQIDINAAFALRKVGLVEAPEMGAVLAGRVHALSRDPQNESVLIIARGPQDDAEDQRWLAQIEARAEAVRFGRGALVRPIFAQHFDLYALKRRRWASLKDFRRCQTGRLCCRA